MKNEREQKRDPGWSQFSTGQIKTGVGDRLLGEAG